MKENAGIDLFFSSFDSNLNHAAQVEVGLLKLLIIPILVKLTICSLKNVVPGFLIPAGVAFRIGRVKTDKDIIKDLPDKVEQKLYCNLTKEQASLYEAVVKDVSDQIENTEGIW